MSRRQQHEKGQRRACYVEANQQQLNAQKAACRDLDADRTKAKRRSRRAAPGAKHGHACHHGQPGCP